MARYFDVHPVDPQPRAIAQVVELLRDDGLIAYPTDSCYALGIQLGNRDGLERIKKLRRLDDKHHFTLVCHDFAQLGQLVHLSNAAFRADQGGDARALHVHPAGDRRRAEAADAPEEAHRRACASPTTRSSQALLAELGEPLLSSTLLMPGETEPMTDGWQIKEELDHWLDAVIDSGECGSEPTTVVDFSDGAARRGAGRCRRHLALRVGRRDAAGARPAAGWRAPPSASRYAASSPLARWASPETTAWTNPSPASADPARCARARRA